VTLALGSRPKQRAYKGMGQDQVWESHSHAPKVQKSVRERTVTLPSEFPCWELESWWIPECLESDCKGQNLMDWEVFHIIGKILKLRCLKSTRMTHLDIWNISYGQKKGRESNWQFDSRPLKVGNRPDVLMCKQRATYCWKALNKGYNFVLNLTLIGGLHTKLWGPKVIGVPTLVISGLPLGSLETKSHLDVGLVERHRMYYKRGGGGFPQVRAMVSLVSSNLPIARPSTKSARTMH